MNISANTKVTDCVDKLSNAITACGPESVLWLAVIKQALTDATQPSPKYPNNSKYISWYNTKLIQVDQARLFFSSQQHHTIIDLLGINTEYADRVIDKLSIR